MIFIKQLVIAHAIGLASGGIVAAGVFAFLAIISVFPRLIGKTKTWDHTGFTRQSLYWEGPLEMLWIFMNFLLQ